MRVSSRNSCGRFVSAEALERRVLFAFQQVVDIWPGREDTPTGITTFNNKVFFAAQTQDGSRAYSTDGTATGTAQIAAYDSGSLWQYGAPVAAGGRLFFRGYVGSNGGLWSTAAGTVADTVLLTAAHPQASPYEYNPWAVPLNGKLVFAGNNAQ